MKFRHKKSSGPAKVGGNVSIINHYAPFRQKDGWSGLHLEIAKELVGSEWNVHIVAAGTSHPAGRSHMAGNELVQQVVEEGTTSFWIRVPEYSGNGVDRIQNMLSFALRLLTPRVTRKVPRPDVVIGRVVNPAAALSSWIIAKARRAPYILEVSDIWPATLVELGKLRRGGLPARTLGAIESLLIRTADAVMSPLPHVDQYLKDRGFTGTPFYWVPNGISTTGRIESSQQRKVGGAFAFMYFGSLGNANAVDTILRAFARLTASEDAISTLEIVGSGPLEPELRLLARELGLGGTVTFSKRIPRDQVIRYAQRADALVANMRDLPLYRYGVALNKMFDYLLSGRPVIFATNAKNNIVRDADAGITVPADDVEAIASAMRQMMSTDRPTRERWSRNGWEHVLTHYTYERSAARFERMLDDVTSTEAC